MALQCLRGAVLWPDVFRALEYIVMALAVVGFSPGIFLGCGGPPCTVHVRADSFWLASREDNA